MNKVQKFTVRLSKEMTKEIMIVNKRFMKNVQKSAKLRAPRETGFLAGQIRVKMKGKFIILDTGEAYYAYYQEFGFRPHLIPREYFQQHRMSPNIPGQFVSSPRGYSFVGKSKPFMIPAMEINIAKLPTKLNQGARKAIKRARR